MRNLTDSTNVPVSDAYPSGRIKDNTGSGDGTPVDEKVYGDIHQAIWAMVRRWGIIPNGLPDNIFNGYQIVEALRALPSKNDFVADLGGTNVLMTVPTKLNLFETGEAIICKCTINFGISGIYPQTSSIKGSNNATINVSVKGRFYVGDYVLLIRTASGADMVLLTDSVNLERIVTANGFLKGATEAEEAAGGTTQATTPHTNLYIFVRRVNGDLSDNYLAAPMRNGLMSMEDKEKLDSLGYTNRGSFESLDVGGGAVPTSFTVTGDLASATLTQSGGQRSTIRVVCSNTHGGLNYKVNLSVESLSAQIEKDSTIQVPVWKKINATTFDISIREDPNDTQALRIHVETIKL